MKALTTAACLAAILPWTLAGCGSPSSESAAARPQAPPKTLLIAAASDLQDVLPVLAERFHHQRKVELKLTFGASGELRQQIKEGGPYDVFLSANQKFVKELADGGFVRPESVKPYALGSLVLAVRKESGNDIEALDDLARPGVKAIALANPDTAPYGAAGKQALERAGLWKGLGDRVVIAKSVRQALQLVQSGNAEAGLVGRSISNVPEVRIVTIDTKLYDPIVQALGVTTRTDKPDDAEAFARFVLGPDGRKVLTEFGFRLPEPSP